MTITKAVIPAAGYGTRMLPAAKAIPKEMLPVIDRPTIQYVVEECARAGADDVLLVTSRDKRAIEDHFDRHAELEERLNRSGKGDLLASINNLASDVRIHSIRQPQQRGLGDAVWQARDHVGDEPFLCLLGDTIFSTPGAIEEIESPAPFPDPYRNRPIGRVLTKMGKVSREQVVEALSIQHARGGTLGQILMDLGHVTIDDINAALRAQRGTRAETESIPLPSEQLVKAARELGTAVIGLEEVPPERVSRYGIVGGTMVRDGVMKIDALVEKPRPESAPSRYAIAARYVLTPTIFACLERTTPGAGGEIQLTDGLRLLLEREPIHGVVLRARRHDIGNPLDWLMTNITLAARDPHLWSAIKARIAELDARS